jgi:hypothetical protein
MRQLLLPAGGDGPQVHGDVVDGLPISVAVVLCSLRVQVDRLHGAHEGVPHPHPILHHHIQVLHQIIVILHIGGSTVSAVLYRGQHHTAVVLTGGINIMPALLLWGAAPCTNCYVGDKCLFVGGGVQQHRARILLLVQHILNCYIVGNIRPALSYGGVALGPHFYTGDSIMPKLLQGG